MTIKTNLILKTYFKFVCFLFLTKFFFFFCFVWLYTTERKEKKIEYLQVHGLHHRSYFKRKKKFFFFFLNPGFGGFVSELPPLLVSIAPPEVMKLF